MTLLVAALFSALALITTRGLVDVGGASTARVRAQTAADAAALGAVAESGPYGRGAQAAVAESYAEKNGARLVSCDCRAGGYEVQVTVEVDGARATARAEIDPVLITRGIVVSADGLQPAVAAAVDELVEAAQGAVYLVSGWRSPTQQEALWSQALAQYGDPEIADDWVAPPGHSMHEKGLAVDLGGDLGRAVVLIEELGLPLWRPLSNEPWHFELVGSRS